MYDAVLAIESSISLTAPRAVPWTETWILDAATVWHCDFEGIPVVHHQDRTGRWQPQWRPWPGETVTIHVPHPNAISGQTKTIEHVKFVMTPGIRSGQAELTMTVRTSHGGPHTITLPPKANLQLVTVNDKALPIRQNGQLVTVPLSPGQQRVVVQSVMTFLIGSHDKCLILKLALHILGVGFA